MQKDWHAALQQILISVVSFKEICYDPQEEVLVIYDLTNTFCHRNTCRCRCCFCLSMSNQGINLTEIWCIFKFSLKVCWHVPYDRPNCQLSMKWYFIGLHWQLCKLSRFHLCNWRRDVLNAHTLKLKSAYVVTEYHLKVMFFHGTVPKSCYQQFIQFQCSLPDFETKLNINVLFFLRKLQTSFNTHTIHTL